MTVIAGLELGDIRSELFSAVVGDIMDAMGFTNQFLPPRIHPLSPEMVIVGPAMTVVEEDVPPGIRTDRPFGLMFEALDDLREGEVYLSSGSVGDYALWGELMSQRARYLGAAGAVVNGYSRDTNGILDLGFPTFSLGRYAQDQGPRGRVTRWRVPITVGNVDIRPGDIVFGDIDGVCIVPQGIAEEVFEEALEKARTENLVRSAIIDGMGAAEAFDTYGVM